MATPDAAKAKRGETHAALVRRALAMDDILATLYPHARAELEFSSPLQLLVATILSAQSTDRRVNEVTRVLFARYPDAASYAEADRSEMEAIIHPVGFFRNKTDHLIKLGAALEARFGGEVPRTLEELVTLPGVGRKTANVVLGNAFGVPAITTDTHVIRLSHRFGWTKAKDPEAIEHDVEALFPRARWTQVSHHVIWHGRRYCHAQRPACGACPLAQLCPAFGTGPTDPTEAAKLIREPRR